MRNNFDSTQMAAAARRAFALGALAVAFATCSVALAQSAPTATVHRTATHTAPKSAPMGTPSKTYGSKSAPITLELFTDYQCPTCKGFYEQTLRYVISQYVSSGKVYIIHHDFPLQMHPYSGMAARWANAAATVGQFETIEGTLYDNQEAWAADGNIAKFVAQAMPAPDFQRVETIMKSCPAPAPQVQVNGSDPTAASGHSCPVDQYIVGDIALGMKVPVTGTPTYIITYKGQKLAPGSGHVSWPVLKQFFDSLLAQ